MVQAARQLIRERGYNATAFSDVLALSGAPRGSVYFHFPGGKTQLAREAAEAHAREQVTIIDRAAGRAGSAAELVELYVDLGREGMVDSDYGRGCGVAPLVTEGAARESAEVGDTARRAFSEMTGRLAFHFVAFGVDQAAARELAHAVIAGVQGAMVTSRALQSPAPYDAVRTVLVSQAASVSPRPSAARPANCAAAGAPRGPRR